MASNVKIYQMIFGHSLKIFNAAKNIDRTKLHDTHPQIEVFFKKKAKYIWSDYIEI